MQLLARWTRAAALAAVTLAVAACGDDPTSRVAAPEDAQLSRTPTFAAASILVGADSNPVTVARGASANVNVRVARIGGFTGPVTLAIDTAGLARGVRVALAAGSPGTTIAQSDTAPRTVTISVDTSAAVTTAPTTFRVSASGAGATTQTLLMQVNVVNAIPGFTLGFVGTTTGSTVQVGQSGTVRLVVRRTGGFTGPVTFTADALGLPSGVTVTQGATVGDTVTLNIAAASAAQAGNFTISLRGAGTGVTAQTIPLALTVQPVGGFSLGTGTTPIAVTAQPGQTITVPVRITRTGGFGGRLGFFTGTLPTGVTATFDTTATTATSDTVVTLRLTVPAGFTAGTFPITVRGASAGLAEQTATINVTVPQPGFQFGLPTAPLTVLQGFANAVQIPITRVAGFADSIAFSVSGAPAGLIVQSTTVPRGTGNATTLVNLTAGPGIAAGTYPITITGMGADGMTQSFATTITVVANNSSFGFQFRAPSTATVQAGSSVTVPIQLERIASLARFASVNATTQARGLTLSFDRTQLTEAGTVNLTIAADAALAPSRYVVTVTGSTEIGTIPSVSMIVTVTPGGTVTVTPTP